MAASALCRPGTKFGPCVDPCKHGDCAASREQAAAVCAECGELIGYGRRWWRVDGKPEHETCTYQAMESAS